MRLLVSFAFAASLAACRCGPTSLVDGGETGGGSGGSGGTGGSGGGSAVDPCGGPCPANQVCDVTLGHCVGGCPAGQGTCTGGCCPWNSIDASTPMAMSGRRPVLLLDGGDRAFIAHRGYVASDFVWLSYQNEAGGFESLGAGIDGPTDRQLSAIDEPDGGRWLAGTQALMNGTHEVALLHLVGGAYAYETLTGSDDTLVSLALFEGRLYVLWRQWPDTDRLSLSERIGDGGYLRHDVAVPKPPSWTAELRIDPSGTAHIAYGSSGLTGGVFYGEGQLDGSIAFEQLAGEVSTSQVSLELGADADPHVVYWQLDGGLLHWAHRTASGWERETVTRIVGEGWNPALALDPQGRPHVSYFALDGGSAHYAVRVGTHAWDTQTIDPGPDVGAESDLALRRDGTPCVAYAVINSTYYGLRYACLPR